MSYFISSGALGSPDLLLSHSIIITCSIAQHHHTNKPRKSFKFQPCPNQFCNTGANVQGPQNLITVKHISCSDGCTPKLTGLDLKWDSMNVTEVVQSDYNSYECGRRGKCDYSSGQCTCFSGYSGLSCGTITSLV